MNEDIFGNRMKEYEQLEAGRRCLKLLPVVARLDGKGFSSFTQGLQRPFDKRLSDLMVTTTKRLVEETGANCGYTQSDEITLAWYSSRRDCQIYFDGKIQKMVSTLAAICSVYFNKLLPSCLPEKQFSTPTFDCRVWTVPTLEEGANCFLWREQDATKNSISMAASHYYNHSQLMNKTGSEKQDMLFAKGVNWNDYPDFFKRGTFVQKRAVNKAFAAEELAKLPPKHAARSNPQLTVERSEVATISMPPFGKVVNRVAVIFEGKKPEVNLLKYYAEDK